VTGRRRPVGPDDLVAVTGAGGFIGSHIVRAALRRGARVRAVIEPGTTTANVDGTDAEVVEADVRDRRAVEAAVGRASLVVHAAALYRFWLPHAADFYDVNVGGTRNVIEAAATLGCRVVVTSTVGTIGLDEHGRTDAVEGDFPRVEQLYGHYKRSKYVAEHEALRLAAEGADVVLTQPTFPVGDGDRTPTPTGGTIVRFLDGKMPAYVDTVLNVVDVDDVAEGHLLAAECGEVGRSYILGGQNVSLREVLVILGAHTGLPVPRHRVPAWTTLVAGRVSTFVEGRLLQREPTVPYEAARMATSHMAFDDRRAREELGYRSRPPGPALARAADWFVANGYVSPARRRLIRPPT